MINQEIANLLFEIGYFLEMQEAAFRPQAYERAAVSLENLNKSVADVYQDKGIKGLEDIPGVGKSIAEKIEEYIKTGKIKYHQKWKNKVPVDLEELMAVEGIGPKTIKTLYEKLGITDLKSLEQSAKEHEIRKLFGFGEKTEKNILNNISLIKNSKKRFVIEKILPLAKELRAKINKRKEVKKAVIAGSIRRKQETVGDIDLLVVSKQPLKTIDFFVHLKDVDKVWGKGETKASVRLKKNIDCDLRVVEEKAFGAALLYFTGPKEYNVEMRKLAISKGWKLNEYGLFKGKRRIAGRTEKEIYKKLGLCFVPAAKRGLKKSITLLSLNNN